MQDGGFLLRGIHFIEVDAFGLEESGVIDCNDHDGVSDGEGRRIHFVEVNAFRLDESASSFAMAMTVFQTVKTGVLLLLMSRLFSGGK